MTHWFPGRWIGSTALVLGPLLLLTGTLLRAPFPFFFPHQIAAIAEHPGLMAAAQATSTAGNVLLCPAVLVLVHHIGRTRPALAKWGGALVLCGLFERTFHAGVDQAAHRMVRHAGAERATALITESYQDLHLFSFLSFTVVSGWLVLALGAHRSRVLGTARAVALALTSLLPMGVLKGTEVLSVVATAGLCAALVPAGVRLLLDGPRPDRRSALLALAAVPALGALAFVSTLG
ncbi:hypothetical protein [Saccharothrix coeruleofusca]|uniref:Uncharacterized protein n=1 Tax=Saccharothrix coeruleofusca TaxID=33919 RepID=A0A918EFZ0_9PSEU|nr:hypothetical protein [Saccharothrix coeruleofusca]MBP2337599.1 hypothetical protein [Saccharothrix coeruleofusca]GGP64750.1 hypothetical protein GCM10010185_41630 [Saccharothrix coeruleofusca]